MSENNKSPENMLSEVHSTKREIIQGILTKRHHPSVFLLELNIVLIRRKAHLLHELQFSTAMSWKVRFTAYLHLLCQQSLQK